MVERKTPPQKVPIPEGQPKANKSKTVSSTSQSNQNYPEQNTRDETVIMIDTSKDSGNKSKKTSKKQS
jgi:hypothetical protein